MCDQNGITLFNVAFNGNYVKNLGLYISLFFLDFPFILLFTNTSLYKKWAKNVYFCFGSKINQMLQMLDTCYVLSEKTHTA